MHAFVGSDAWDKTCAGIDSGRHVLIVAPAGHGKSMLLRELTALLSNKDEYVVEVSSNHYWTKISKHLTNFASKRLPIATKKKVFVMDDVDVSMACDRGCTGELKDMLQTFSNQMSAVLAHTTDFLPTSTKWLKRVIRVNLWPTPLRELCEYGHAQGRPCDTVEAAARASLGSFPHFVRLLSGGDSELAPAPAGAGAMGAVEDVLTRRVPVRELEYLIDEHGAHMFVDSVVFNAGAVHGAIGKFARVACESALCGPTEKPHNSLESAVKACFNVVRCAKWRAFVADELTLMAPLRYTNLLPKASARCATRRRHNDDTSRGSLTLAEIAAAHVDASPMQAKTVAKGSVALSKTKRLTRG